MGSALVVAIALVGCGGSGGGGSPAGQTTVGGSDQLPISDGTGASGSEGGEGGDVGCNENECECGGECPQTFCWNFCTEKDVSYVLVATDCPDQVSDVTVRDLYSDTLVGSLYPNEPSAAVCDDELKLTGFKVEDIDSRSIRVCVTTTLPQDALTIQLKYALTCENISGACFE